MSVFCGIDIGTSGVKAVLSDADGAMLGEAAQPLAVSIPQRGWSEQDPDAWVAAVFGCLDALAAAHPAAMAAVAGIGLSGQMLAALLLDEAHRPVRPAMLWNDQRALAECADLSARVPDIGLRTNGAPDPGLTAPKLLWLARHEPQVLGRAQLLMLTKDYVRLALTGEVATEPTDAGGTQLFDCAGGRWDPALCAAAGWEPAHLPPVVESWAAAGCVRPALAARWGLRAGVPVAAGAGDNMATTLGAGAAKPGDCVITLGTSGVTCIVDGAFHPGPGRAILTSAHAAPGTFLSMGVVMAATQALDWVAGLTGQTAAALAAQAEALAETRRMAAAPVFLPCLTGIRTPLNRPDAEARIDGLHPGVDAGMLAYAAMEGVAFQIGDCVAAQAASGVPARRFMAVGGGARSLLWLRLLATLLDRPVEVFDQAHASATSGAARLAAVAAGADAAGLKAALAPDRVIAPDAGLAEVIGPRRARFVSLLPGAAVSP